MEQEACVGCSRYLGQFGYGKRVLDCSICLGTGIKPLPNELLCNMCGGSLCPPEGTMNAEYPNGLYKAKVSGGYDSYHLFDGVTYQFSFCEKCLRHMFKKCKIKPLISSYDEYLYETDQKDYEYRLWKDKGFHSKAYTKKICNQEKNCRKKAVYSIFINGEFSEETACEEHAKGRSGGSYSLHKYVGPKVKVLL